MNLSIYGLGTERKRKWLAVDLGVSFASEEHLPGIDLILPDIRYLMEERKNLAGLVLTHAHEDHFGAVLDLWPRLKMSDLRHAVHRRAARRQARERTGRAGHSGQQSSSSAAASKSGRFDIELVSMAHSIPESNALIIRTPLGAVLHTGDWKIDPTPILGRPDRREEAARARRRRLPRAGRRFDQCRARGPLALGSRCGQNHRRTGEDRARPRRGDHLRLERGAPARRGRCRARRRPRGGGGRPRHGAHRAGRARDRLFRRRAGFPAGRRLRLSAAEQGRGAVHRQPGRAARRALAYRRGPASGGDVVARRPRDRFGPHHSRQRKGGRPRDERA